MTIQEMHIGIDLGLQQIDSKIYSNLLHEEKDYYINLVTSDLINAVFNNEKNTTANFINANDIKKYYNVLQKFIRNVDLSYSDVNDHYEAFLPQSNNLEASYTSGLLINGVRYRITTAGTTDLTAFGYSKATNVVSDEFDCNISEINVVDASTLAVGVYKILNAGGFDFTAAGFDSVDNNVGTTFTVTTPQTVSFATNTYTPVLKPLQMAPTWAGSTALIPLSDVACYLPLSTTSVISIGDTIMSGSLTPRQKYIVDNAGTTAIDLSTVGGVAVPSVGYVFTCTSDAAISWTANSQLHKVTTVPNRIVIFEEVYAYLNNRFGSIKTAPISVYMDDKVNVYHGNKFNIHNLALSYIIKPVKVDYNNLIDSNLPEYIHSFLMDLVVKRISATIGSKEYSGLRNEIIDNKQLNPGAQ